MASCSWAITEPDPGADLKTDSDKMIREKPDDLKKYVVCKDAVDELRREGKASSTFSALAYLSLGKIGTVMVDISLTLTLLGDRRAPR